MSDQNYFEKDAISATLLKAIIKQSPVPAEERMKSFEPTANMKLGTAFHAIMLEPENYGDLIAVTPNVDRRTKAGKEEYNKFLETVGQKTIITTEQEGLVQLMWASTASHPEFTRLNELCYAKEMEIDFMFEGMQCKSKIDMVDDNGTIVDIKTTQDASPEAFMRQSANLLYHLQLAWYAKAMGLKWNEVDAYIVAVENSKPHGVAVYKFSQIALLEGWELCKRGVELWKEYKENCVLGYGSFPYGKETVELDLPMWARNGVETV